jgi:acyl-CoA reductase-like NAD-dependent aldehyde dehydrogenase/anthranilate/para-aminobenzoate synthase component II
MKKRIGITFTQTNNANYGSWFTLDDLGEQLEIFELSYLKNNFQDIHSCDGFVLTGGVDVHPSLYDGPVHYENKPLVFELERDKFEAAVYAYAKQLQLPVLGICRGLQLVNTLEGGKLLQDLEEGNSTHRKTDKDKRHEVKVAEGSLLHSITLSGKGTVNSAHHQSIDPENLASTLKVSAIAEDGTVEAVEFKDSENQGFLLCLQWHPERMEDKSSNPFSINIKRAFLKEINKTNMKKMDIINPATEEIITTINTDDASSLNGKMETLKKGQIAWQKVPVGERVGIIRKYTQLLVENIEDLAKTLTNEMGKPLQQSRNEVHGAITRMNWLMDHAVEYLSEEVMNVQGNMKELIRYEPLGVICNISAWNFPYLVGTNVYIPALLAGNSVMYKPSEFTTLTGLHMMRLLKAAGIPDDAFQVAIGGPEVGEILLDLPMNGYYFTGSYKTGKYIYERVAPKMVPCQCELGGKDPLYVADDVADLKSVVAETADGAFFNNGQSCCSVERIYVQEKIYDDYVRAFEEEVRSWKVGDPKLDGTYISPISRKSQITVLENQVSDALRKGARLLNGGKKIAGKGYYFEPTVLVDVDHTMSVMREESFGPIIGIMKVSTDDEAVRLMQDTEYGLTASIYSSNQARAEKILSLIDTGTSYWNCCDRVSAAVPWSGRKHSGFGSTLSHVGLRAFTKPKAFHLRSA